MAWDDTTQTVRASKQYRLEALVLSEQALSRPDPGVDHPGVVGWRQASGPPRPWLGLRNSGNGAPRVQLSEADRRPGFAWPDLSDDALQRTLDDWLGPFPQRLTTLDRVKRLDLATTLAGVAEPGI